MYTSLIKQILLQLMHHKYGTRGKSMFGFEEALIWLHIHPFCELLLCVITLQYPLPVLQPDKVYMVAMIMTNTRRSAQVRIVQNSQEF